MSNQGSLLLLRHGESAWNLENRFTGWVDVPLTENGKKEALEAGRAIVKEGIVCDVAYTSVLKRAIHTLWLSLEAMDMMWLPIVKNWRLNERHYGALQGLNKAETAQKYGDEQVHIWRRSYATSPPALDEPAALNQAAYGDLATGPKTESLKDTVARVLAYWRDVIEPEVKSGKNVLISAHGNSLRALVKHLDGLSEEEITKVNIPNGVPLLYRFDATYQNVTERRYLD